MKNTALCFNNEKGAVAILMAILIPVLLGIMAFAIDIGYTRIVRNQLQNGADAAALAACNHFYERTVPDFSNPADLIPNWDDAVTESVSAITDNTADNHQLEVGTTEVGWWDFTQAYPGSMWPDPLSTPPPDTPPAANYGPAVMVTVTKTAGQNSGPVSSFFGRIFGFTSYDNGATATAIAASPGSIRPEALIPWAIAECVVDDNDWTKYDGLNDDGTRNEDELIALGSDYHYPNSQAGQWTTFLLDTNKVPDVAGLIDDGNPTMLSIGDDIWIAPGTMTNLYGKNKKGNINDWYAGYDVVMPVVPCPIDTHADVPIRAFIGFHVVCAGKGCNGKTIEYNGGTTIGNNEKVVIGYFTTPPDYGDGPIGPHYGPTDICRLCK